MSILGTVIEVCANHYFLSKEEELEVKRAQAKRDMIQNVSSVPQQTSSGEPESSEESGGVEEPEDGGGIDDRIDELLEDETCSTCRHVLQELRTKDESVQKEALAFYENEFIETKKQFANGEVPKEAVKEATDTLMDKAGFD